VSISSDMLRSISTPDQLETRVGTLEFVDGVPSGETVETAYDHLDFAHALNVFLNGYAGASTVALRKGLEEAGAKDNEVLIFSELMDSASLFLTANADTAYFLSMVDLRPGRWWSRRLRRRSECSTTVVAVDRRFRPAGPGSRRGRPVPARPAGLRRAAARQRLPRRAFAHDEGVHARPRVHQREPGHGPRSDR
jgi:hypothetical protein